MPPFLWSPSVTLRPAYFGFRLRRKSFMSILMMISLRKCQKLMMMTTVLTIIRMTWILPFVIVSEMQLSVGLRKWRIQIWNSSSNFLQIWNHQKSLLSIRNILNSMPKIFACSSGNWKQSHSFICWNIQFFVFFLEQVSGHREHPQYSQKKWLIVVIFQDRDTHTLLWVRWPTC